VAGGLSLFIRQHIVENLAVVIRSDLALDLGDGLGSSSETKRKGDEEHHADELARLYHDQK